MLQQMNRFAEQTNAKQKKTFFHSLPPYEENKF